MKEGFKRWLCEKAGYGTGFTNDVEWKNKGLEILIKAMWAINREAYTAGNKERYFIIQKLGGFVVNYGLKTNGFIEKQFDFCDNFEQEALMAALKYIYEQKKEEGK